VLGVPGEPVAGHFERLFELPRGLEAAAEHLPQRNLVGRLLDERTHAFEARIPLTLCEFDLGDQHIQLLNPLGRLRLAPGFLDHPSRVFDAPLAQQRKYTSVTRVWGFRVALLRVFEIRERRIEIAEFELCACAQHQRGKILIGISGDGIENGEHADRIAYHERGSRNQDSKLISIGVIGDPRFE